MYAYGCIVVYMFVDSILLFGNILDQVVCMGIVHFSLNDEIPVAFGQIQITSME